MTVKSRPDSEKLFEQYLSASGITDFQFEKSFQETSKKPDYSLFHCGTEILFEVKEFQPTPDDFLGGRIDSYGPIREKIGEAREKFQKLKKYCCCLVLYNAGRLFVDLDWQSLLSKLARIAVRE